MQIVGHAANVTLYGNLPYAAISALNNPNAVKRFNELGYLSSGSQPEEFGAYIKSEIEKLAKVLRGMHPAE